MVINTDNFWNIIEKAKHASNNSIEEQTQIITERLIELSNDEIVEFRRIYVDKLNDAYTHDLWDACNFITCGGGEQRFIDFRAWLIAQGKAIYQNALTEADTLAEIVSQENRLEVLYEEFSYIAAEAYEKKTGKILVDAGSFAGNPKESRFGNKPIKERFPNLYAKLGECPDI